MPNDADPNALRRLKLSAQFGFIVIGIVSVLLGLVLPILSARLSLNDAEAGSLFLAQFSGSLTGTLVSGRLIRHFGFVTSLLIGFALLMLGLPGLNTGEFPLCWLSIFVYGLGLGISIPATNLMTIEITPLEHQASSANFINFCWGLGAIICQPFVALFAKGGDLLPIALVLDASLIATAVLLITGRSGVNYKVHLPDEDGPPPVRIWTNPLAWLFAAFNFCNIGIETGLGGWLTTYSQRLEAQGRMWINTTIIFFTFLVIGRGVASIISRYLSENRLLFICSGTLLIGIVLILANGHPATPLIGAAVAGLGTSAIFPTNMVRFTKTFGPAATRRATPLFISGIVGAAAMNSMIGHISTRFDSLAAGIFVLLASSALMVIIQTLIAFYSLPTRERP